MAMKSRKKSKIHKKTGIRVLSLLTLAVILIGTVFYHSYEAWGWIDSFYFSVITLTTVGYGDFFPTTMVSKIFTTFYVLIGIGIMLSLVHLIIRKNVLGEKV